MQGNPGGARFVMSGRKPGDEEPGRGTSGDASRHDGERGRGEEKTYSSGHKFELSAETRARLKAHIKMMLRRAHL
jgi:hypothetical protein